MKQAWGEPLDTPLPSPKPSKVGNFCTHCTEGQMEVSEGQTGLLPLTLEGSHVPYTGQLEVGDRRGLPELQVGLPGDEMGAGERWTVLLSTYCVPAAKQEAEPREQGLACLLVFRAVARGATRASRNVGVKVGPLLGSNLTGPAGLQAPRKCSWGE